MLTIPLASVITIGSATYDYWYNMPIVITYGTTCTIAQINLCLYTYIYTRMFLCELAHTHNSNANSNTNSNTNTNSNGKINIRKLKIMK
jgi:hypothetical protein